MNTYTIVGLNDIASEGAELKRFRHALSLEHSTLLQGLRDTCDELRRVRTILKSGAMDEPLLAFEIVIAIGEREDFATMDAHKMVVVLLQMEQRLRRLAALLHRHRVCERKVH